MPQLFTISLKSAVADLRATHLDIIYHMYIYYKYLLVLICCWLYEEGLITCVGNVYDISVMKLQVGPGHSREQIEGGTYIFTYAYI